MLTLVLYYFCCSKKKEETPVTSCTKDIQKLFLFILNWQTAKETRTIAKLYYDKKTCHTCSCTLI